MRRDLDMTLVSGAIIGVVDLIGAHVATDECVDDESICAPWGKLATEEHGGRTSRDVVHLVLENPRPLDLPIPWKGRLGLWTPPADVLEQLHAVAR